MTTVLDALVACVFAVCIAGGARRGAVRQIGNLAVWVAAGTIGLSVNVERFAVVFGQEVRGEVGARLSIVMAVALLGHGITWIVSRMLSHRRFIAVSDGLAGATVAGVAYGVVVGTAALTLHAADQAVATGPSALVRSIAHQVGASLDAPAVVNDDSR